MRLTLHTAVSNKCMLLLDRFGWDVIALKCYVVAATVLFFILHPSASNPTSLWH